MKTCTHKGCNNNQFGGMYCAYHQYFRRMRGGDLYKPKPRQSKPINKESPRRKKENKRYREVLKEFWTFSVENNSNFCFFCGKKMTERDNIHHLSGRIENKLLDTTFWVNAHEKCHLWYHGASYEQLLRESWYAEFLNRLKQKDTQCYYKELKKQDKSLEMSFE